MPNQDTFTLKVVTPTGVALEESVEFVKLPGENGEIGIYQNHSPSLVKLHAGKVRVHPEKGDIHKYFIPSGFSQILENEVTILAPYLENADEINIERAEKAKQRALKRLKESDSDTGINKRRARQALFRAERRLYVHKISNKKKS